MANPPTPRAPAETPAQIPSEFLDCRLAGHAWERLKLTETTWRPVYGIGIVWRCFRCRMERHDTVNSWRDGVVGSRSYEQPEGYRLEKGTTPTRDVIRVQWMEEHRRELLDEMATVDTTATVEPAPPPPVKAAAKKAPAALPPSVRRAAVRRTKTVGGKKASSRTRT